MVVSFSTDIPHGMCSKDRLELLDAVDCLRLQGIDHFISLPQIIVCGDQSSGKSSVLEAISGVPFPVSSNLCTRFPTELILRRAAHADAKVSIIPNGKEETTFSHNPLDSFDSLPDVIDSAKLAMGISTQSQGFSKDLLRIEISGPDHPHLTIVDLPGLVHSATKQQSASDVELVRDVVKSYMAKKRSIILAVVSAKNDFANQIVLKLAQSVDSKGLRTLGVITKPDTLVAGSKTEAMFVSLAQNKEVEFRLGWHVLKNLDSEQVERSSLLHQRNEEEERFFADGVWKQLPTSTLGVRELRVRLSDLLLRQVATELPSLIVEIDKKRTSCQTELDLLGSPCVTLQEQRLCLLQISQRFQVILKAAIDGTYNDPFFENTESKRGQDQRLRAVVQRLNADFALRLENTGHKRSIVDGNSSHSSQSSTPEVVTRDVFVTRTQELMRRIRGCELPGLFNSVIVTDLFHEQSTPWKQVVLDHMESIWRAAKIFLDILVNSITNDALSLNIRNKIINPALAVLRQTMDTKAIELIELKSTCHPVTYNRQYSEEVQRLGNERREQRIRRIVEEVSGSSSTGYCHNFSRDELVNRLSKLSEPDTERNAASEALDYMNAFYNVALKRFVDDVANEIVERQLMAALPGILSPVEAFRMEPETLADIVGESQETQSLRLKLEKQLEVLNKGSETCNRFVGLGLDDWTATVEETSKESTHDQLDDGSVDQPVSVENLSQSMNQTSTGADFSSSWFGTRKCQASETTWDTRF